MKGKLKLSSLLHAHKIGTVDLDIEASFLAAPERLEFLRLDGVAAHAFSLGVLLFSLLSLSKPFNEANKNDSFYTFIVSRNYDEHWKKIEPQMKLKRVLAQDVKSLIISLLSYVPSERCSIKEILASP